MLANRLLSALILLALSQVMVGINIVGSKYLVSTMPIFFILAIRFTLATGILLLLHGLADDHRNYLRYYLKKLTKRDWMYILLQALTAGVFFNLLMILGLRYTSANIAGIITSSLPALIAFISWLVLKESFTMKKSLCIGLATIGLLVISLENLLQGNTGNSAWGNLLIFLAMLPEACYYVLTKMYTNVLPVFLMSALMNGINAIILLPIMFFTVHLQLSTIPMGDWLILIIISISSGLFYVFWYMGANRVDAVMASLSTAVMPIATVTIAWLALREVITLTQMIGMVLVISSIVVYAWPKKMSKISSSPQSNAREK